MAKFLVTKRDKPDQLIMADALALFGGPFVGLTQDGRREEDGDEIVAIYNMASVIAIEKIVDTGEKPN